MQTKTEPIRLVGWENVSTLATTDELGVKQRVFGQLVKLCQHTLERYQSDLYHDAKWIDKHLTEPCVFYFAFDASGTAIGTDDYLVRAFRVENAYRIELLYTDGAYFLLVDRLTTAA